MEEIKSKRVLVAMLVGSLLFIVAAVCIGIFAYTEIITQPKIKIEIPSQALAYLYLASAALVIATETYGWILEISGRIILARDIIFLLTARAFAIFMQLLLTGALFVVFSQKKFFVAVITLFVLMLMGKYVPSITKRIFDRWRFGPNYD